MFVNEGNLVSGMKFNMTTDTEEDEVGDYKTTFTGNRLLNTTTGTWNNETTQQVSGNSITKVTVEGETENSQIIYLLLPSRAD